MSILTYWNTLYGTIIQNILYAYVIMIAWNKSFN